MKKLKSQRIYEYNKNYIANISEELFYSFGIASTSLEDISLKGDISRVTIYKYFPSKLDIAIYIYDRYVFEKSKYIRDNIFSDTYKELNGFNQIFLQLNAYSKLLLENSGFLAFLCELNLILGLDDKLRENGISTCKTLPYFKKLYMDALEKGLEDKSISKDMFICDMDNLFARKVVEGIMLKYYLLYGRSCFFTNKDELYEILRYSAEKTANSFLKDRFTI